MDLKIEKQIRNTNFRKKKELKLQSIYSRCLLTNKVLLPINCIGKNLDQVIEEYIKRNFEGKCVVEGYIKPNSSKIIRYSCGNIHRGNIIVFEVIYECDICFPIEGMLINCIAKNITKAGIRAESENEVPSPVVIFIAKDHHYNSNQFGEIKEGDKIVIRVIGQRFELNDKYISIIGELIKDKEKKTNKPRLVIEDD
jgi:DNA-directed RNA polymerase subunit E'/Rpb7